MSWRVAWETGGTSIEQHAQDFATHSAAAVRLETLKQQGISRRVMYAVEGDGAAGCWCEEHNPTEETA